MLGALKESIDAFQILPLRTKPFPTPSKIERETEIIEQKFGINTTALNPFEIDKIYKKFIECAENDQWNNLSLRDWKNAPHILFYGDTKIITDKRFILEFDKWISKQKSSSIWKRLIAAYLRNYNHCNAHKDAYIILSDWITNRLKKENSYSELKIWQERNKKFKIFDKSFNAYPLADAFIESYKADWNKFVNASGLSGELSSVGYIETVGHSLLIKLLKSGGDSKRQYRDFFETEGKLRFPGHRKHLIEALLLPWLSLRPQSDYQKDIQDWLIRHFKDPRVTMHRNDGWRDVSDEALSVIKRWQVGTTIKQFFDLISQIAEETHWQYRKKFWETYNDKNHISDAWVVLGPETWQHAVKSFGKDVAAGKIGGGQFQSNHSVLMIRIGEYVFCEWSHVGKCRSWHYSDPNCPKFYRTSNDPYNAGEFRTKSLRIVPRYKEDGISHLGSESYSWQYELSEFIGRNTRIKVNKNDFII